MGNVITEHGRGRRLVCALYRADGERVSGEFQLCTSGAVLNSCQQGGDGLPRGHRSCSTHTSSWHAARRTGLPLGVRPARRLSLPGVALGLVFADPVPTRECTLHQDRSCLCVWLVGSRR